MTACAEMQKEMDLLKAATKEVICKKHLTFLSMHLWAFNIYLLALVTTSLLIHDFWCSKPRIPGGGREGQQPWGEQALWDPSLQP